MKHELTLTLKPMMYSKVAKEQFAMTKQFVLDILRPYKHTTVAELTSTNNIHYHSLIDIDGIIQKDILLNRIRPYKYFGKPHLQAVQFEESYEKYLLKDLNSTIKIINEDPLIKDDWKIRINSESIFANGGSPLKRSKNGAEGGPSRNNTYRELIPQLNEDQRSDQAQSAAPPRPRRVRLIVPTDPSIYDWYKEDT